MYVSIHDIINVWPDVVAIKPCHISNLIRLLGPPREVPLVLTQP